MGRLFMTLLFLLRLFVSFKGSAMQIQKRQICVIALAIAFSFLIGSTANILGMGETVAYVGSFKTVLALRCVAFAIDILVNVLILALFCKKLWQITLLHS